MSYIRIFRASLCTFAMFGIASINATANQPESTVTCVEGQAALIEYGDSTQSCEVGATTDVDQFTFVCTAGETVRINLRSNAYDLDPYIRFFDPASSPMPHCDDYCTVNQYGVCSVIAECECDTAGTHTFVVSDFESNTVGAYTLGVDSVPPVARVPIAFGDVQSDTLAPTVDIDTFGFNAVPGDRIRVNFRATSYDLDPRLEIFAPDHTLLRDGTADGAGCEVNQYGVCSVIVDLDPVTEISQSGTYTISVSDSYVDTTGNYQLSVWCVFGPSCPIPKQVAGVTGDSGKLSLVTSMEFFSFHAEQDSEYEINVRTDAYDLDLTMGVRDPDGTELPSAGCSVNQYDRCSFTQTIVAPKTGLYQLAFSDSYVDNSGSFHLNVHCMSGVCDLDGDGHQDSSASPLDYGGNYAMQIKPSTDVDFFSFSGTAGDLIELHIQGNAYDLDPRIRVFEPPNGTLIDAGSGYTAQCTVNQYGTCSILVPITVPADGIYGVEVYEAGLDNVGAYTASVQCLIGTCANLSPILTGDNCVDTANPNQTDSDGDGFGSACDADFDGDYIVGISDFGLFTPCFGSAPSSVPECADMDFNSDDVIGFSEFGRFTTLFGDPPGPSAVTCRPEDPPSSFPVCPAQQ